MIPIIELCLPLIEEVDETKNKLNILPPELENLKKQAEFLQLEPSLITSHSAQNSNLESHLEETECKLDFLITELEAILIHLADFNYKIKNLIVLKERLEALQEERSNGLTPERIYRLLELQQKRSPESLRDKPIAKPHNTNVWWRKIINYHNQRLAVTMAIIVSLSLGWIFGYSSSINFQTTDSNVLEQVKDY